MSVGAWFRTDFDEPSVPAALPMELTSGMHPSLTIVDQMVRGRGIIGRITGDFGAVAVKVAGTGGPVRVTVSIGLDEISTRWWADRVRPSRTTPELPRLVVLRAQGRIRGSVVLARRQGWRGAASAEATLSFDLAEGELDSDGLLMVELGETPPPSWATGRLSTRPVVGLRFNSIAVHTTSVSAPATVSTGSTGCDFAVLQPGAALVQRLSTQVVPAAPPLPLTPRNRFTRRRPARAAFKVARAARRVAYRAMPARPGPLSGVLAADVMTGAPIDIEVSGDQLRLPGPIETPVLLGAVQAQPTLAWRLK
ncbi:hypothetical protein FB565_004921 [Actinoplanes lutulentus]|uniref:Uncharacterized protein n=1 Tax=Actinoplanes lutulentus TaxID=1287878 RepID=A0A327Z5U9_9ACTN|nr:hypothetical protein [Actinoplanes lutulentus]MBB2945188.1 hypothetical protein [Actinoplanes lutulentus]RAK31984.1 hypothetical protein B0I29_114236 [Actinoplanes lutulentus]